MTRMSYAGVALVLGLLLGVGWYAWIGCDFTAWVRVRALAQATEATRLDCAESVAELGWRGLPALLGLLTSGDEPTCQNAQAGLIGVFKKQSDDTSLTSKIVTIAQAFPGLSPAGQAAVLSAAAGSMNPESALALEVRSAWAGLLARVPADAAEPTCAAGLELAGFLLGEENPSDVLEASRSFLRTSLQSPSPAVRLRAVRLTVRPGLDLDTEVAKLLRDPAPDIRRAALLVIGPAERAVLDEVLLPSLRDEDADVQRLAEAALLARGLTPRHLKLGRLVTDPSPLERLKVIDHLNNSADLEPGVWLRRLSHDPADSVRATTVRVMAQQQQLDLRDRLEEMRRQDPSPTVSQLAGFYLKETPRR